MKSIRLLCFITFVLCSSSAFADSDKVTEGMANKAVNGAVNFVTGIVELPMQVYKGYKKGFPMIKNNVGSKTVGTVLGVFRGFGHAAGRTGWGGLELFGFWTANRPNNHGIGVPLDAKYAWEMGEQYSIFKPTLGEGVKPIGRKLVHGVTDSFLGILEVPGQAIKGSKEGKTMRGLGRGVWFWFSRTAYGFGSVLTCLVPNPKENPGYSYKEKYPWSALTEKK